VIDQKDEFSAPRESSAAMTFFLTVVRPEFAVDFPTRMSLLHICACCILAGAASQMWSQTQSGSSTVTDGARSSQSEKFTGHAEQLINAGDLKGALTELDALAIEHPALPGLEYLRGFAYYQQTELSNAETAFRKALSQDPQDRGSRQLLGITLYREGRPADAIPVLETEHASRRVTNEDPSYLLSLCYIDVERYDDARRTIAGGYGFPPNSPAAYLLISRILVRRGFMVPAEASARKALELNPRVPLAHELLGEIAIARSDIAAAIKEFESERALDPLRAAVYEWLGDAYLRDGDVEQARESLNRSLLLDPNSTGPYILLGKVLMRQHNPLAATGYLQRALRMDPGNYIAHYLLGQAYHATGRPQDASREFEKADQLRFKTDSAPVQVQPQSSAGAKSSN
jgi:tetratricopeptide (TPR) repeat protein